MFPSYLLITLLSVLAISWYASSSLRHFYLDQTAADLKTRALLVEKQIVAHLAPLDVAAVDTICKEIGKATATRITSLELLPAKSAAVTIMSYSPSGKTGSPRSSRAAVGQQ